MGAILFGGLFVLGLTSLSAFAAFKLLVLLRRGEGRFRGVHVVRSEDPARYWITAGSLVFAIGVTAYGASVFAMMLYPIIVGRT